MQHPPLFSVSSLEKRFGRSIVLRNISFDVLRGDFVLLLGSNGAGKTTLLKILASLMRPSRGSVQFEGKPQGTAGADFRAAIGMISHDSQFYGDLTARENLKVFGTLYRVPELAGKIEAALEEVALLEFPDVPVRAFSSGMVKRLALGRLLLYKPRVLLLDEPYAGLDRASVVLLDNFLNRFMGEGGTTVLITHQLTSGVTACTRLLILHRGGLVYNRPAAGLSAESCAALLDEHTLDAPLPAPHRNRNR